MSTREDRNIFEMQIRCTFQYTRLQRSRDGLFPYRNCSTCLSATTLEYAGGRLTADNGKRARMPIVEPSRSADGARVSRARVDCRRPSCPSCIDKCPDRSLASPQIDRASPCDLRPLQTESAVARKSLAQNVAVAKSDSFQARQLSHANLPSATLIGHGQSPQTRRRAQDVFVKCRSAWPRKAKV
jgi:hypothetical protein